MYENHFFSLTQKPMSSNNSAAMSNSQGWLDCTAAGTPYHEEVWCKDSSRAVRDSPVWVELAKNAIADWSSTEQGSSSFRAAFRRYFLSDYVFVEDFINVIARAIVAAPDFDTKKELGSFLNELLQGEASLFRDSMWTLWGIKADDLKQARSLEAGAVSEVAIRMSNFLRRVCADGNYLCLISVISIAEVSKYRKAVDDVCLPASLSSSLVALDRVLLTSVN